MFPPVLFFSEQEFPPLICFLRFAAVAEGGPLFQEQVSDRLLQAPSPGQVLIPGKQALQSFHPEQEPVPGKQLLRFPPGSHREKNIRACVFLSLSLRQAFSFFSAGLLALLVSPGSRGVLRIV